jgi:hypothetical protein
LQKYRIDYTLLKPVTPRGLAALVNTFCSSSGNGVPADNAYAIQAS